MVEVLASAAADPVGAYPHAQRVGNLLFLSGVGPRVPGSDDIPGNLYDDDGKLLEYDIEAQTRAVLANVRAILGSAGARWADLVDITVFLIDMKADFDVFNKIYAEYFTTNRPCRTTVEINALPTPIAVELKCIAYVSDNPERDL